MNYLAHIYLSGDHHLVKIGNFIADGIKGKSYTSYQEDIQIGILLHRHIDTFTDAHSIVRQSTKRLHQTYGHFSGIIVDIFYDHFLAKNWKDYSDVSLETYANHFYDLLTSYRDLLPLEIQKMMPYMMTDNWLVSYATLEGISKVLHGMNKRTKNRSGMDGAIQDLKEFYNEFQTEFTMFFEDLKASSKEKLNELNALNK